MEYLALPFVLREGYLDRATLLESLTYSIGLLLSTRKGQMHFDPGYGCDIWEKEFSDLYAANKADIRASLRNAIDTYERRLFNVSVTFVGVENRTSRPLGMVVKVSGNFHDEGKEKSFEANYVLG
jgi:phage baseplate assembly protein W